MANRDYVSDLDQWQPQPGQSKDQIITWLYSRKDLKIIIKKIAKSLADDLRSELFLWLCLKPEDDLKKLYDERIIDYSILEWINRQWHSSTSPFYNKIRKFQLGKAMTEEQAAKVAETIYTDERYDDTKDLYDNALQNALADLRSPPEFEYPYYHRDILMTFLRLKTIKATAKELNIRPEYISQAINDAKELLKPKISAEVENYLNQKIR